MQFHQLQIPTPCTKRSMDEEQLCLRLHKRLRIGSPSAHTRGYSQANSFLQQLHTEQMSRRQHLRRPSNDASMSNQAFTASGHAAVSDFGAMTHFVLGDVVQCSHGAMGRCLQCTGRLVQNVPLQLYSDWCGAFSSPASSSTTPQRLQGGNSVRELTFPSMAALIACLSPEPGERLLHLASGLARVVGAWVLLVPRGVACGVESNTNLHEAANAALERMDLEVQQRILLHHGCLLEMQSDWHQAGVILVSGEALDDVRVEKVAKGLERTQPGTRIASIGRPLLDPSRSSALQFIRQAPYRTVGSGNTPVFIYRKPGI
ncbi:unnamed protein product [Durusdinium trenchii]|uniref:Uncharacterized protein n=1 Tax=Durusdinium trenchii TaxID=1381693 RepID=A0ABP0ISX4_9DINO